MNTAPTINVDALRGGMKPGLSPVVGASFAEAASVCLGERGHASGCTLVVDGAVSATIGLAFTAAGDDAHRSWNDGPVATEHGAYGLAILLVNHFEGYTVVERSRKGTGFDFWLGRDEVALFQNKARLEVSGIREGNESTIAARVKEKCGQLQPEFKNFPAFVAVVEYSRPLARLVKP